MRNPWEDFRGNADSWILPIDHESIQRFNSTQRDETEKVVLGSIPEPFIGNPESARLVLLGLNPGHSDDDLLVHREQNVKASMLANLRHEPMDFPFYPLNPDFQHTGAARWWNLMTGRLRQECGLDLSTLSRKIMVIEWFPYHSQRSGLPARRVCESQEYTFQLALQMLHRSNVFLLGMRSMRHWVSVNKAFAEIPFLINKQRPFLSRGNMEAGVFDSVLESLVS